MLLLGIYVPSIDFSFANKDLIAQALLFYIIFCQILNNQVFSLTLFGQKTCAGPFDNSFGCRGHKLRVAIDKSVDYSLKKQEASRKAEAERVREQNQRQRMFQQQQQQQRLETLEQKRKKDIAAQNSALNQDHQKKKAFWETSKPSKPISKSDASFSVSASRTAQAWHQLDPVAQIGKLKKWVYKTFFGQKDQ